MSKIANIELDKLISIGNVRKVDQDTQDIHELAETMGKDGQQVEIHAYPVGKGKYAIKFGHRRVAAARLLGWDTIRAIVDEPESSEDTLVHQVRENDNRLGMSYIDKASVYQQFKDELGWSQAAIASRFGISQADVSLALAMLRADPKLQQAVEEGRIKPSAIEPLLSQPMEVQHELADRAIREKTVRKVSALVKANKQKAEIYKVTKDDESDIPEDIDPLEVMAMEEINEALRHLKLVEETAIKHPELKKKARPRVEELLRLAASLRNHLGLKQWDDLKDLE
jgi:ParB family transcriptional regulator, chromosome partitioning protein